MNKKIFILIVFTLLTTANGFAKTRKYYELGINQSQFRNESCEAKIGYSGGIGIDFYPIESFGAFLGSSLLYENRRILARDRTWPSSFDPEYASWIVNGDIDANISYLEIPFSVGYTINLRKEYAISIITSYSYLVPLSKHTRIKNERSIPLSSDERGIYDFDYVHVDENFLSWSKNYGFGFRFSCKRYALSINYSHALTVTKGMSVLSIQDKIDSIKMSFFYFF